MNVLSLEYWQGRARAVGCVVAFREIWDTRRRCEANARHWEGIAAIVSAPESFSHWEKAARCWDQVCQLARLDVAFVEWCNAEGIA